MINQFLTLIVKAFTSFNRRLRGCNMGSLMRKLGVKEESAVGQKVTSVDEERVNQEESAVEVAPASSGKLEVHKILKKYLFSKYNFRYNVMTDQVECRPKGAGDVPYELIDRRELNTMVIEAREQNVQCWDKDVERLLKSNFVDNFHPFYFYMDHLPAWDGVDRITPLAMRVDDDEVWVHGFRRWLLALAAQWMGVNSQCANTLVPMLVSPKQGMSKSTFCRLLMPPELEGYYLDKFDINSKSQVEWKLAQFGLINLDEFDRYSATAMAALKNLVQMKEVPVRKPYVSYVSQMRRLASFIGTSNQMELLNDPTGSRRFLCVEVKHKIDCSPIDHGQLFAQLKSMIVSGERVWMNTEEEEELQEHNLLFKRLRPEEEVFYQVFEAPTNGRGKLLSATEIHRSLCKSNPSAMRGVNVVQTGKMLTGLQLQRRHTREGNKYLVAKVERRTNV